MRQTVRLADIAESSYGLTASAKAEGPARFLRITDIEDSTIRWSEVPFADVAPRELSRAALQPGDLVVARTGASVGRSAWVQPESPAVFASYLVRFRTGPGADSRYVGYVLRSEAWQQFIHASAHGKSAQPNISASAMSEFTFDLPELHEQRAIADVLGALDDKIAANTRLAATAVELAAALFTEALTAARWTTHTFDELAVVSGGGTPSTKVPEYWGGSTNWATPSDVTALSAPYLARTDRMITEAGLAACSSRLFEPGAILMTSRATIGAFAIARAPLAVNQGFIVVEPRDPAMRYWLFHEMKSRVDEFISMANGATFLELSRGKFKPLRVRLADPGTMSVFDRRASALHDAAFEAAEESRTLVALRDLLLPRLMSGEVRAHVDRSE